MGTQKVTRVELNIEQNNDYILLGLVSADPDYKLSLAINKKFRISLRNLPPVRITGANSNEFIFSRFSDNDDPDLQTLTLISNRSGKSYLLNKLRNIDYLVKIILADSDVNTEDMASGLREIDAVTAVFNIDLNSFKDKNLFYLNQ